MKVEIPDELLEEIGATGEFNFQYDITEIGWEQIKDKYKKGILVYTDKKE